jgi:hypothetical protein
MEMNELWDGYKRAGTVLGFYGMELLDWSDYGPKDADMGFCDRKEGLPTLPCCCQQGHAPGVWKLVFFPVSIFFPVVGPLCHFNSVADYLSHRVL